MIPTIPPPPFDNLELGPLTFHLYGLLIGLAIIAAMQLSERLLAARGHDTRFYYSTLIPVVICGFVGSRVYHVLSEPVRYWNDPLAALEVWNGGLGIYGAVFGGLLGALWFTRKSPIPFRPLLDSAAAGLPLAQAIGRWGNYVNQELFGGPSTAPWALEVEPEHRPAEHAGESTFHPTFLYESLAALAISGLFTLLFLRWRSRAPGVLFPLYVAAYSVVRFFVEDLRVDDAHEWLGLRQNQWVALGLVAGGVAVAVWMQLRWRRQEQVEAQRHVPLDTTV